MRKLVARWGSKQDVVCDPPDHVHWEDGPLARFEDYAAHQKDTHVLVQTGTGVELWMFPEAIADVRYDGYQRLWFLVPPKGEPVSLDLTDWQATDLDLRAAMFEMQPFVYRVRIHR